MIVNGWTLGLALLWACFFSCPPLAGAAGAAPAAKPRMELPLPSEQWTGDLDGMIERRMVRVLVAYKPPARCGVARDGRGGQI